MYDEAMERIRQQPKPMETLALRVLSWIVYAVRPLQLEELQHAIAAAELEPDDRYISEENLTPQSILVNACAGMIKIDEASNVIGLVHKSTQDYFDRSSTKHFPHAQRDIGTICVKYLSLEVFSSGPCSTDELYKRRVNENVLLEYAAGNLGNLIRGMTEHNLHGMILKFLLDERQLSSANQAFFAIQRYGSNQNFPRDFNSVHYATYFSLEDIL